MGKAAARRPAQCLLGEATSPRLICFPIYSTRILLPKKKKKQPSTMKLQTERRDSEVSRLHWRTGLFMRCQRDVELRRRASPSPGTLTVCLSVCRRQDGHWSPSPSSTRLEGVHSVSETSECARGSLSSSLSHRLTAKSPFTPTPETLSPLAE